MKTLKATLAVFLSLSIFIATPGIAFAANTSPHPDIPTDSRYAKAYQEDQETIAEINRNLPQLLAEGQEAAQHDAKAGEPVLLANSLGTYGDILVSTLIDSGSVAFTGHAAIVSRPARRLSNPTPKTGARSTRTASKSIATTGALKVVPF